MALPLKLPPLLRKILGYLTDALNIGRGQGWWNRK